MKKIRKVDDQRYKYEHKETYVTTPVESFFYALVAFAIIWVVAEIVS
jgi:hypothetical protein